MLTLEKVQKIMDKLANSESLTIVVDHLKIRKQKTTIKIEGALETDKEYLIEMMQFYLPYLKVK